MKRAVYIAIFSALLYISTTTFNVQLGQNYPNPAKDKTYIEVSFDSPSALLTIHDVLGKKIEEKVLSNSGTYELNLTNYNEGVYLYTLDADGQKITKRMTVVKR